MSWIKEAIQNGKTIRTERLHQEEAIKVKSEAWKKQREEEFLRIKQKLYPFAQEVSRLLEDARSELYNAGLEFAIEGGRFKELRVDNFDVYSAAAGASSSTTRDLSDVDMPSFTKLFAPGYSWLFSKGSDIDFGRRPLSVEIFLSRDLQTPLFVLNNKLLEQTEEDQEIPMTKIMSGISEYIATQVAEGFD